MKQKVHETLKSALIKIIKLKGLQILDNVAFCRAMLKDMAKGEFVDEITLIVSLLEKKYKNKY
jgi:type III secretory pathway component EscU